MTGELLGPTRLLQEVWQAQGKPVLPTAHVTPLLRYDNHTTNPFVLFNLIWANIGSLNSSHFPSFRETNDLMSHKKNEILRRWHGARTCQQRRDEAIQLRTENRRAYDFMLREGQIQEPEYMTCPKYGPGPYEKQSTLFAPQQVLLIEHTLDDSLVEVHKRAQETDRFTAAPTQPPVVGCTPTPQCFDLCCIFRALLELAVQVLNMTARFFNGLIQGNASIQGSMQNFPYFTGEAANYGQPTFESDLVALVLDVFAPIVCVCEILNLIIPVVPTAFTTGRPDICCAINEIAVLIAR
jgi:hypothetical protein